MPAGGRALRLAFALVGLAFFATPLALALAGLDAQQFENRRFVDAPKLSQGWDAFPQASRYVVDRMPLRAEAVRANTRIWTGVFDTDPPYARARDLAMDQALPFAGAIEDEGDLRIQRPGRGLRGGPATASSGRGGWLYVGADLHARCDRSLTTEALEALRGWGRMLRAVRSSGRETAMFVAPDKASVYPEYLPDRHRSNGCLLEGKDMFWRLLSRAGPRLGVHELRSELLRRKAYVGDGLFQRSDMHWTTLGALTLVDAVLDTVGDGIRLEPNEIVARGAVEYTGDLAVVGGDARTDLRDEYGIERPPGAPRVPGRTLLVCDSFAYRWLRLFKPYFESIRYISWYEPSEEIVDAIRKADRILVEANESMFWVHAGSTGLVEQRLDAEPSRAP